MKEVANKETQSINLNFTDILFAVLRHLLAAFFGFFCSRGLVLEKLIPFGIGLTGGVNAVYSASCAAGAAVGYITVSGYSFRYVAAILAVAAIKILLHTTLKNELKPIFSAAVVALVTASTGIVMVREHSLDIVLAVAEALLASGYAYFVAKTCTVLIKPDFRLTTVELSSLLIAVAALFTGLFSLTVADVSVGRVLAVATILFTARFGGVSVGAICGTALGFAGVLSGGGTNVLLLLCFGGLIGGVFLSLNKYAGVAAFLISVFVSVSLIGTVDAVIYIVEAALGAVIFLCIPKNIGIRLSVAMEPLPEHSTLEGVRQAVTMRLNSAADALTDVSGTVEQIARELSKINAPDFSTVLKGIEENACKGCNLRVHCWETKKADTLSAVLEMTKAVKQKEPSPEIFAPEEFKGRCLRPQNVGKAVNLKYSQYAARISAENRIDEVRSVVSDQFSGISDMLRDLSTELETEQVYDNTAAGAVINTLKTLGYNTVDACCKIDKFGRMSIEARIKKENISLNKMTLMQNLSLALDRDFDRPSISEAGNTTIINLTERTVLEAEIGVNQICSGGKNMCGDAYNYFYDGRGKLVLVLSDGMGTGGRAAVDGAMASGLMARLLRAGFGYDCSLRILNSSMLFKSTDESLATVDVAVIDLYTGRTDLLKAGAAPTLVRRSGRTGKAQSSSLPVGILRDIGFDKATIRLKKDDILLMMSDGATGDNTDWINTELNAWGDGSAQELSQHISLCAKQRRTDNHEDDITVIAVKIHKAY